MTVDVVELTKNLIQRPSITPDCADVLSYVQDLLTSYGFTCIPMNFQSAGKPEVHNLFAYKGAGSPHLCFAGHLDVVPVGNEEGWRFPPFSATTADDKVYGRGAVDMKGAVAAFIGAALDYLPSLNAGTISLLITGDEEGDAIDGTAPCLRQLQEIQMVPDFCIVGEPTSENHVGDMIKNGRRGSLSGKITVRGKQGHVAYPHRAVNPIPQLVSFLDHLQKRHWDDGNDYFDPSNLEVTSMTADNVASNVIPHQASAQFNIRYNTQLTQDEIQSIIRRLAEENCSDFVLDFNGSAQPFISVCPDWKILVSQAIVESTGKKPQITTTGGTSDARFIHSYCPVIECGLKNETAHAVDEHVALQDLHTLQNIYRQILHSLFMKP